MISVGSRDGRKGVGFGYDFGGEEMELGTEFEEGEACFQKNDNDDDDDSTVDPDVALSYIDEKIEDLLGHVQKDFEGGVSAENLGSKFGGYGSFLPTYQRSPKTPSKILTYNASISPNDPHIEGGCQNSVSHSSQSVRHEPDFVSVASVPAPRGLFMNGKVTQEAPISSTRSDKFTLNGQQPVNNFANASDQRTLKVRIKVGSDNLSTKTNAEIYCGLGLDASPSSSLEASPVDSDGFFHATDESPTSILEIMTSFPVRGSLLLSPLPYNLLYLTEKERREDKRNQESTVTVINGTDSGQIDQHVLGEKSKSFEKNSVLTESTNGNDVGNGIGAVEKPNRKDGTVGKVWEAKNTNGDEKNSLFRTKADLDVSKGTKTLDVGLVKPPKEKAGQEATSREEDGMKLAIGKETSSSKGKKKSKGSHVPENDSSNVEVSKGGLKNDDSSTSKSRNNTYGSKSYVEDFKKNNGKPRVTYKDFFGELDLEQDDDMVLEEKPSGDSVAIEKSTVESNRKERFNGNKSQKPSSSVYARVGSFVAPTVGNRHVSDAAVAAPIVNEDWVCCDKCEKWRLLPPGVNPGSLPEKWLCSMLDWLPGMNRCSISEEETTKAISSRFPGPARVQGFQPVHPGGPQSGVIPVDSLHPDQRHGPLSGGVKRKHGSRDLPNKTKQDRPSLSSNSSKKNLQTSFRSRSLNGVDQSRPINEVEFQDSGLSRSLIAKKHRRKHKEKKKLCDNFMDEVTNAHQSKIRNKREASQDFSKDSKKVKTDGKLGTDEDRASEHGRAVFKPNRSSTSLPSGISSKDPLEHNDRSALKVPARYPENQNQINSYDGTFHVGKSEERDVLKRRKPNEFEDTHKYVEEMCETDHRKEKQARVSKSTEEETCPNVKMEQQRSLDVTKSSKRNVVPVHASLAATSSSSKVSSSHKTKGNNLEGKGSPVESVSSSPLKISNLVKFTSSRRKIEGADDCQDAAGPKKCSDGEDDRGSYRSGTIKKDDIQIATHCGSMHAFELQEREFGNLLGNKGKTGIVPSLESESFHVAGGGVAYSGQGIQFGSEAETSAQGHNEEWGNVNHSNVNGSRARKNAKGSSSRSKDKSRCSSSDIDKINLKNAEPVNANVDIPPYEEKSKRGRNKSKEKPSVSSDKFEKGYASRKEASEKPLNESAKQDGQSKHGHHDGSDVRIGAISSRDVKQNLPTERDCERSAKRDVSGRGKSHSLPPSGRPIPGSPKENAGNTLSVDAAEGNNALKGLKKIKKAENQNGNQPKNMRHPIPNRHKSMNHDAPSPLRRDSSSQAATNALKEAKDLKHLADRVKNSGSNSESRALYLEAALKFLHGASLLESCYSESGKHGDMIQSIIMYSSTAKLCEFCAHEYEKSKEMSIAALAYKCAEVAYLKVVYSSHAGACKDRHELQTSLQLTGESTSSASDLDNLNNLATVNKVALAKGVDSPQVAGNHVIAAQNKPHFVRILNFAQDVNFAMEASRKSQVAFAAFRSKLEEAHHKEGISVVKKALDFNFHNVDGLLHLVRLAIEVIHR